MMPRSRATINTKIQQGGPWEPFAEPTLFEVYKKDKEGKEIISQRTGKRILLGRIPTLDTQFTIPRP